MLLSRFFLLQFEAELVNQFHGKFKVICFGYYVEVLSLI